MVSYLARLRGSGEFTATGHSGMPYNMPRPMHTNPAISAANSGGTRPERGSCRRYRALGSQPVPVYLPLDPFIGLLQAGPWRSRRFPAELLSDQSVIRISAAHTERTCDVFLDQRFAGNAGYK